MRIHSIILLLFLLVISPVAGSISITDSTASKFDRYFYEGVRQREQENYAAAFDIFRYCHRLNPNDAALLLELGKLYFAIGRQEEGTRYLEQAYRLYPDNKNYGNILGAVYERQGRADDAVRLYEEMSEQFPSEDELRFKLANMYVQAGEIDKAIYIYNRMEAQNAVNAADASNYAEIRARLYLMTGQTNKALNELRRLCNRFPEVNEFRLKYAGTLLDSEKYDEAYEQLQLIARTDSTSGLYHFAMASYYLGTNEKEAAINEMIKVAADKDVAPEQKLPIILRFIGTDTDEEDAPKKEYNILLEKILASHPTEVDARLFYAELLEMQGDSIHAMEVCRPITEFAPKEERAWKFMLGRAVTGQNHTEVHRISEQARQYLPGVPLFYLYDAISYYIEKKSSEAKHILQEALEHIDAEKDPNGLSDIYSQLGDLAYEEKKPEEAFANYEKALELNPRNVGVLNNYAYFLAKEGGDLAKAERMAAQCVKLLPDNAVSLDTYGWVFFLRENYTLAKLYIEKALGLTADNPDADVVEHHGDVLYMLGEKEKALLEWKRAKEIGGGGSPMLDKKIEQGKYIPEKKK